MKSLPAMGSIQLIYLFFIGLSGCLIAEREEGYIENFKVILNETRNCRLNHIYTVTPQRQVVHAATGRCMIALGESIVTLLRL